MTEDSNEIDIETLKAELLDFKKNYVVIPKERLKDWIENIQILDSESNTKVVKEIATFLLITKV